MQLKKLILKHNVDKLNLKKGQIIYIEASNQDYAKEKFIDFETLLNQNRNVINLNNNWKKFKDANPNDYVLLYHATSLENAKNILKNGFKDMQNVWIDSKQGYTYLGDSAGLGTYLAPHKNSVLMIVKVKKKDLEPDLGDDWKSYIKIPSNKEFMKRFGIDYKNPTALTTYSQINQVRALHKDIQPLGIFFNKDKILIK